MPDEKKKKPVPDVPTAYWITKPHYIQQEGEPHPKYVEAYPDHPTKVVLPAGIGPSRGMKETKPDKPKTGFNKKKSRDVPKVGEPESGRRAADQ